MLNDQASRLYAAIAAVCPILGIGPLAGTAMGPGNVRIDYDPTATAGQKTAAQNAVASFDWTQRTQRTLNAILTDLNALTAAQQNAIGTNFFATQQLDQTVDDEGIRLAGIVGRAVGIDAATVTKLKFYAIAVYCRAVNVKYLVRPSWAPTVNVPGDQ